MKKDLLYLREKEIFKEKLFIKSNRDNRRVNRSV